MQGNTIRIVNVITLLMAIALVLALPVKKDIWYDESISILCSKGITYDTPLMFAGKTTISSADLDALNDARHVFRATVCDNSNSYLYNIGLHWFTGIFGNSLLTYTFFSKLLGIGALLAFFTLCRTLLGHHWLTSLAIGLLVTDMNFVGMSHEIRAYMMGIMFATLSGIYLFRYLGEGGQRPGNLMLVALFAVGAVLSHFLSVYVALTFFVSLLLIYGKRLFTLRNVLAIALPLLLLGIFFYFAWTGLQTMSQQNEKIVKLRAQQGEAYSIWKVITSFLRAIAVNFRFVAPSFTGKLPVLLASFAAVPALYIYALRNAGNNIQRRHLHILFAAGISSSVFLGFLCLRSGHLTAFYYRYHSFAFPFCIMFLVYVLYVLQGSPRVNKLLLSGIAALVILPVLALFVISIRNETRELKYNQYMVANAIVATGATSVEVPSWTHAFLIHSFMPQGHKVNYIYNDTSTYFTLRSAGGSQQIKVVAKPD
ncbi:hypothetical protein GCM10023093_23650 [Nemorincola caseinilytica]|uniref:Glycosyltransferase RgtA/B/C/D-like domain-containing protein n=1 Tax=Nemorincola caseinilytica TaxID=2054315 RepID=A0ABP8NKW8_9BACT